ATVSVPGAVHASVRAVHVAFAFLPLLRGRFVPSRVSVEGLDAFLTRRDGRGVWVEGVRADVSAVRSGGRREISVSPLAANVPRLALEGTFRWDPGAPRAELSARGSVDGDALRTHLLALAGDDRTVADIFDIFRGGRLTSFSFESE